MERKLKIDEASRSAAPIVQALQSLAQESDRQGRALIALTALLVILTGWLLILTLYH